LIERKSIKCKLKSILYKDIDYTYFYDVIDRTNNLTFIVYQFIRAYILYAIETNIKIPNLNTDFIRMAFKAVCKSSPGRKPSKTNNLLFDNLQ
jgi:hypothetical protein